MNLNYNEYLGVLEIWCHGCKEDIPYFLSYIKDGEVFCRFCGIQLGYSFDIPENLREEISIT